MSYYLRPAIIGDITDAINCLEENVALSKPSNAKEDSQYVRDVVLLMALREWMSYENAGI